MKKTLKKMLKEDNIYLELNAETKEGIIKEIIDHMAEFGLVKNKKAAYEAVIEREEKMSTGMENGIAIPHGKTDSVDRLCVAIARKKGGVDFDSIDKRPSTIFVVTISPVSYSGPHLQFLAEVGKLLRDAGARRALLEAKTKADIIRIFT